MDCKLPSFAEFCNFGIYIGELQIIANFHWKTGKEVV